MRVTALVVLSLTIGCDDGPADDGPVIPIVSPDMSMDSAMADIGSTDDAAPQPDVGTPPDAGEDAAPPADASPPDMAPPQPAGELCDPCGPGGACAPGGLCLTNQATMEQFCGSACAGEAGLQCDVGEAEPAVTPVMNSQNSHGRVETVIRKWQGLGNSA